VHQSQSRNTLARVILYLFQTCILIRSLIQQLLLFSVTWLLCHYFFYCFLANPRSCLERCRLAIPWPRNSKTICVPAMLINTVISGALSIGQQNYSKTFMDVKRTSKSAGRHGLTLILYIFVDIQGASSVSWSVSVNEFNKYLTENWEHTWTLHVLRVHVQESKTCARSIRFSSQAGNQWISIHVINLNFQ